MFLTVNYRSAIIYTVVRVCGAFSAVPNVSSVPGVSIKCDKLAHFVVPILPGTLAVKNKKLLFLPVFELKMNLLSVILSKLARILLKYLV